MENKRKIIIVATILIIVLSLLLCACDDNSNNNSNHGNSKSNPLNTAYDTLYKEFGWNSCYTLGSDKSYLQVDTNPYDIDDYYNATYLEILKSAITALKLPDYIYQRMLKTTAMQGRQEVTANGITVSWTYHPNKGLEAMFTIA
ncbi:MAG: hypothetical protein PUJ47_07130 [Clostridia bacterium]|nr:hypothetical protein [Clostridia bacterium]